MAQNAVEKESRFEIGSGRSEFDEAHTIAEIEFLCPFGDWSEEALKAAPEIGGLADVRIGLRIFPAQKEYGGARGNRSEYFVIPLGREFEALG